MFADEPDRKLAAIMAVDMVGYSRLVRLDEVGTLRRLGAACHDIIEPAIGEHRGRLFKRMGDGFLAEFPSAVLALRCALGIQTRLGAQNREKPAAERIEVRIGVHQGEVVISGDDLLGDGVNVAARLEPLAEAGGICVSARVHEDSVGKIRIAVDDLGDVRLKNIDRAIRVLRVRVPGTPPPPVVEDPAEATMAAFACLPAADSERTMVRSVRRWQHRLLVDAGAGPQRRVDLGPQPFTIGRTPPCDLILADPEVSRRHCRIDLREDQALLGDLGSTNGTFVNGERLRAPIRLEPDARIGIGSHVLVYQRALAIEGETQDEEAACG